MGNEEKRFEIEIAEDAWIGMRDAWIAVRMRRDEEKGLDWAAVLCVKVEDRVCAVCVYDNAHGDPERHRIRRGEKLAAEALPTKGDARLDLPAAIDEIKANWEGMVDRWEP